MNKNNILLIITVIIVIMLFSASLKGKSITGYNEYIVSPKDTLWKIVNENYDDSYDIRKVIFDIEKQNNMQDAIIHSGQVIKLPIYER